MELNRATKRCRMNMTTDVCRMGKRGSAKDDK
jgi:hypothetical protein